MPKVALVFPRYRYPSGDPPIGILTIAAYLREHGHDVSVVDSTFMPKPKGHHTREALKRLKPDIVGVYSNTMMSLDATDLATWAKWSLGATAVVGGPEPTTRPRHFSPFFDAMCVGEGERTMLQICQGAGWPDIPGIVWSDEDGRVVATTPRQPLEPLDALPLPAFDLVDMEQYRRHWYYLDGVSPRLAGSNIVASRGCPFHCSYCQPQLRHLFGTRVRHFSPRYIGKWVEMLKLQYGAQGVFFHDDTLTADREWALAVCDELTGRRVLWGCNARADTLDGELLAKMYVAGCRNLHLGIESASQRVLDHVYHKGITIQQVRDACRLAREQHIQVMGFFMLGAPSETVDEMNATIRLSCELPLTEATFSITSPLPGTALYKMVAGRYKISDAPQDYNYYSRRAFEGEVPYREIRRLQRRALRAFYLRRLPYILRHLTSPTGIRKLRDKVARFR